VSFPAYLSFGGNECINSARVRAYSTALGITSVTCVHCEHLEQALDEGPYTSPDLDDAPWWDPTVVESKDFAGVLGLEFTGLDTPVNTREVITLAQDGAALNQLRRKPREIVVRAMLFARTDCALSYGRTWLAAAVRGGACTLGCSGDELCYLACCPGCGDPPEDGSPDPCGDPEWRTLFNVGILAGPNAGAVSQVTGGYLQEVDFSFTAGNPFIYRKASLVTSGPTTGQVIPGFSPDGVPVDCDEPTNCVDEALDCPPFPLPIIPVIPPDPCFPSGLFEAYRAVVSMPEALTPKWLETVPYIKIRAGFNALKRVTLRWYANSGDLDCYDALQEPYPVDRKIGPCDACAEINIPAIPAGATLTIDGRIERAWTDCPGGPGVATAEPYIYGRGGTSFQWPVFTCGTSLCLEIIAENTTVTSTTSWEIYSVAREDAS
jgi:hypothetical protein